MAWVVLSLLAWVLSFLVTLFLIEIEAFLATFTCRRISIPLADLVG